VQPLQVLDDSTDIITATLVDDAVDAWKLSGVNITRLRRTNRRGYKAGALKEGMLHLSGYDYIAIFDADFKPDPDFLVRKNPVWLFDLSFECASSASMSSCGSGQSFSFYKEKFVLVREDVLQ
jgi:glycosyltransferase involved in cell wall biosynthesis